MIWSWLAAAESHNRLSQNQAGIVENPGLSYGLFHAVANPITSWGVVGQGGAREVSFNMRWLARPRLWCYSP